jgi:RNA polymerase sigma factor (sigma-70 family)
MSFLPTEQQRTRTARGLAAQIYSERRSSLLAVARRNTGREADAEEALHDAFAAFIEHYDPAGGAPPLAWFTLTLKRRCWRISAERRVAVPVEVVDEGEEPGLERVAARGEPGPEERVIDLDDARRRLRSLKADQRDALGLQALGCSYREIGERRGWTYTKVNRSIAEGRAALREVEVAA